MKKMAHTAIAAALVAAAAADGAFVGISIGRSQSSAKITNDTNTFTSSANLVTNQGHWVIDDKTGTPTWVEETQSAQLKTTLELLQNGDSHDTKADFAYGILAG